MKQSELQQIIKEEIKKLLNEKYDENLVGDEYAEGGEHKIYTYGNDKIIKFVVGVPNIGYNLKIFPKYPEIFPKVYDMGKDYVIVDKLDDHKSISEIRKIRSYLFPTSSEFSSKIPPKNPYIAQLSQRTLSNGLNWYSVEITPLIYNNLEDDELILQFKKELPNELFNSLIKNYYPLLKKVKNISWNSSHSRDINDGNFGYDLNGNLKMLDI